MTHMNTPAKATIFLCFALACFAGMQAAAQNAAPVHLYAIGDSTAAAYEKDRYPLTGWAQILQEHFDSGKVLVEDKAKSGRSAKSFHDEGAWKPICDALQPGDYVFIQFGHNDSKKEDPKRFTDPDTTYPQYLKMYIEDTRGKDAIPVLLTSINRNHWRSESEFEDSMGGYPPAMRKLATEMNVLLIDLHAMTRELFERMGKIAASGLFMNLAKGDFPNYPDGLSDNTHLQEQGAREICKLAVEAIKTQQLPLAEFVKTL